MRVRFVGCAEKSWGNDGKGGFILFCFVCLGFVGRGGMK